MIRPKLVPTIIIAVEIQEEYRGYPLQGREFLLKYPTPVHTQVITLDGKEVEGEYWVVSIEEYLRVVPEARDSRFGSDDVFIPTFVAKLSFRPEYIKSSHKKF